MKPRGVPTVAPHVSLLDGARYQNLLEKIAAFAYTENLNSGISLN
jgi:hypothetical protein